MLRVAGAPAHTDEGFTLIEVIISIALISIAFVGILSAVSGLVLSGAENKNAAAVQAAVRNAATFIQSFDGAAYIPCGQVAPTPAQAYQTDLAGASLPAGLTATIQPTDVQFWDGGALPQAGFTPGCPGAGDQGLESVRVTVSSAGSANYGGAFSKSLTVLKRGTP